MPEPALEASVPPPPSVAEPRVANGSESDAMQLVTAPSQERLNEATQVQSIATPPVQNAIPPIALKLEE